MPYKSRQQQAFFHSPGAKKAGISSSTVKEYDAASKGEKLPKYSKLKSMLKRKKESSVD